MIIQVRKIQITQTRKLSYKKLFLDNSCEAKCTYKYEVIISLTEYVKDGNFCPTRPDKE